MVRIHIVLVHIVSALDHCAIQCKLVEFIVFKKKVMIIHYIFVGSGRDQNLLISHVHGIWKIAEDLGIGVGRGVEGDARYQPCFLQVGSHCHSNVDGLHVCW